MSEARGAAGRREDLGGGESDTNSMQRWRNKTGTAPGKPCMLGEGYNNVLFSKHWRAISGFE